MSFYKSIPFDQALTQQLVRVMQEASSGSRNAINAVRALESTVNGYIEDDHEYIKESSKLKAKYDQEVTILRKRRDENELSTVRFDEEKRPLDLEYALSLYTEISRAMVRVGIHPARNATYEEMLEDVPDEPKSSVPENKE